MRSASILSSMCVALGSSGAQANWNAGFTHSMHLPNQPDLTATGIDAVASSSYDPLNPISAQAKWLGQFWQPTESGPVTGMRIWGAWIHDNVPLNPSGTHGTFELVVYCDMPGNPSRPGLELWHKTFLPGEYRASLDAIANGAFYDPNLDRITGTDSQVWQYNFSVSEAEAFVQSSGTIYWLAINNYDPNENGIVSVDDLLLQFGWRSALGQFTDAAMFTDNGEPGPPINLPTSGWQTLRYPAGHPFAGDPVHLSMLIQSRCAADLSGSVDPNDPAYGQSDGLVDSDDFFYFLDQFVAGNLAVADLSGSADPNDPAYGQPDGAIDADDFFFFLDLFVAGC